MVARLGPIRLVLLVIRLTGGVAEQAQCLGRKQVVQVDKCRLGSLLGDCFLARGRSFLQLAAVLESLADFCLLPSPDARG